MIKIDLITGFLGSGKTTFIRNYVNYLTGVGLKVGILLNDFGAVNVDMMLLGDLIGERCDIEMVAGGCDSDCHRRRFKTKLIAMAMSGFDRVVVEPSGIFDVDEFFDCLHENPLDVWYEAGNVITIVDANLESEMSEFAQYILASQLSCSGSVIFSKVTSENEKSLEFTINQINETLAKYKCNRRFSLSEIIKKDWKDFDDSDYMSIMNTVFKPHGFLKKWEECAGGFETLYLMNEDFDTECFEHIKDIFCDESCGKVFRIKGFFKKGDSWMSVNATREDIIVERIGNGQQVIIVIGENLDEESIRSHFQKSHALLEK